MTDAIPLKLVRRRVLATPEYIHEQFLAMREERLAARAELKETLDLLRAIIDQKALGQSPHIPDGGIALRLACHERIAAARKILGEEEK